MLYHMLYFSVLHIANLTLGPFLLMIYFHELLACFICMAAVLQ